MPITFLMLKSLHYPLDPAMVRKSTFFNVLLFYCLGLYKVQCNLLIIIPVVTHPLLSSHRSCHNVPSHRNDSPNLV